MSVHATPVPHFSGKNELSLQDLDALANAVQAQGCTTEYVPAGMPRGRRQYTGANYNLSLFADECSGSVATPDKPGTLASVQYRTSAAPYIDNGNMVLPLAHDFDTAEDSSLPPEQATGGICTISVPEGLKRPQIDRGNILLPLAHSAWGGDAEGAMCTPGLVYAVQVDAADDECSGTVGSLPYIDQGVIHLRAGAGGGGCNCGPAFYTRDDGSCIGLIRSVEYGDNLTGPRIEDGHMRLPLATMYGECPGVCGGVQSVIMSEAATGASLNNGIITLPVGLKGVMTVDGPMSWSDLHCAGVVRLHDGEVTTLGVSAEVIDGYLNIYVDRE